MSNIFRVCSGKSFSLCASAPSFCVRVAAGSQHPAALLPRRGLQLLYTHRAAFCRQARSSTASEAGQKMDNAGIKSLNFRGLESQRCLRAPKQKTARFSTTDSVMAKVSPPPKLFLFHVRFMSNQIPTLVRFPFERS